jgi:uncharacterized membrane protein
VTPGRRAGAAAAAVLLLAVCAALAAQGAIEGRLAPALGAILSLIPIAALAAWAARRASHRAWVAVGALALAILLWTCWDTLVRNVPGVFFLEHAGGNLLLAWLFGRTLVPGREALCTRFARMVHDSLPPRVVEYTRRITLAWTIFFAVLCALSFALHTAGFEHAWSLLATVASPLLIALMFAGEYAVRTRVLPDWERVGILGGVRAFSRHVTATPLERAP